MLAVPVVLSDRYKVSADVKGDGEGFDTVETVRYRLERSILDDLNVREFFEKDREADAGFEARDI